MPSIVYVVTLSFLLCLTFRLFDAHALPSATHSDNDATVGSSLHNMTYDEWKRMRIEMIKQDILDKLGMTSKPDVRNINTTVEEQRQILRKYKKSVEELHGKAFSPYDNDRQQANTFDFFTDNRDKPAGVEDDIWWAGDKLRIYFSVTIKEPPEVHEETVVSSATLKLYKSAVYPERLLDDNIVATSLRVDVYQVTDHKISVVTHQHTGRRLVDSRLVSLNEVGWEEFDVSSAVQNWIRDPSTNLGLEIDSPLAVRSSLRHYVEFVTARDVTARDVTSDRVIATGKPDDDVIAVNEVSETQIVRSGWLPSTDVVVPALSVLTHRRPILGSGAPVTSGDRRRRRRQANEDQPLDCDPEDDEVRCCRYPMTVSFRDIGWDDWIIQPESYEAYHCSGTCPRGHRAAHMFATVKTIMIGRNAANVGANSVLDMQCAPTRFGPLNIAHYNAEGKLVVNVISDFIAEECMCS